MAVDKLVDSSQLDSDLTSVANAIRAKTGGSSQLSFPSGFVSAISGISPSQPSLQSKTVTPTTSQQTVQCDSGYDGLDTVTVNPIPSQYIVPSGTKSITANGTGIDVSQYADADVTVPNSYSQSDEGKVVSSGSLVAQSSDSVTANGTYDTTLINSLVVNVSSSASRRTKSGTFTPSADYNTSANRLITTDTDIGFTPTEFYLYVTDFDDVSTVQYPLVHTMFKAIGSPTYYIRQTMKTSNTSGGISYTGSRTNWTTQTNAYLYYSNGNIYYRTTSQATMLKDVQYSWLAIE